MRNLIFLLIVIVSVSAKNYFSGFWLFSHDVDEDDGISTLGMLTSVKKENKKFKQLDLINDDVYNEDDDYDKDDDDVDDSENDVDDNDYNMVARKSNWRYKACKKACKAAYKETCNIYNCKHIKKTFKHEYKRNCKEEFD
ncbi:hypothetical protein O0L34_g14849 [Tuta absoluta]|nr:hypothetical protein O0L34_g14849 [Tuta absoluta]